MIILVYTIVLVLEIIKTGIISLQRAYSTLRMGSGKHTLFSRLNCSLWIARWHAMLNGLPLFGTIFIDSKETYKPKSRLLLEKLVTISYCIKPISHSQYIQYHTLLFYFP